MDLGRRAQVVGASGDLGLAWEPHTNHATSTLTSCLASQPPRLCGGIDPFLPPFNLMTGKMYEVP